MMMMMIDKIAVDIPTNESGEEKINTHTSLYNYNNTATKNKKIKNKYKK